MKDIIYNLVPIITKRLYINEITVDELIQIRTETKYEDMYKMTCRPIRNREGPELVELYKNIIKKENGFIFSINKKDGGLVGKISFNDYNPRNKSLELGYYEIPRFRKNGYMKEALTNLLDIFFEKFKINKIYAQTASFNEESIRLLENMNFSKDGALRNHHELDGKFYDDYIFSMLSNEWQCFKSAAGI